MHDKGQVRTGTSDEELVRQVVQGRVTSFAEIVNRYERTLFNLMYRFCRSEQEAADLCQEAFLRAYERLPRFDPGRRFFPWLYTLAMNMAKDWQRRHHGSLRKLEQLRWETTSVTEKSQQEDHLLLREEVNELYRALEILPGDTREMILLRYRQETPIRDLAEIFELSESGVKMRIARGLERMKSVLGGTRYE